MSGGEQAGGSGDRVDWHATGVPVSARFDDPYYSLAGGLAETGHVFLAGNRLPGRFRPGFAIAELGFGTGLNLLATVLAWTAMGVPGRLSFTSFEAYPMQARDMNRALAAFPDVGHLAPALLAGWTAQTGVGGIRSFALDGVDVTVIIGDARETLPVWQGGGDAWYLDGFSPAKNPELWSEPMMAEVARHTAPGGTFATYTAAGHVRRALDAAGFEVARAPGYGRKRHMSQGVLR